MTMKRYLLLTGGITVVWVLALLAIPSFAVHVEQLMLLFLSRNAG